MLRVKSKFPKENSCNPILLPKNSKLTEHVIRCAHHELCHSGIYAVLRQLNQTFWIEKGFSAVKGVLKKCISCRKIHERPIKINQNVYRTFRSDPPRRPYQSIFLDMIGPFHVKLEGKRVKIWLLARTCLWSRAVNLKICLDYMSHS